MYATSGGGFYPHEIDQSLRFNSPDSAYLTRTPSVAGNRKTWTWSAWIKISSFDDLHTPFAFGDNSTGGTDVGSFFRLTNDKLEFTEAHGSTNSFSLITNQLFRDPSAWYHFVFSVDTTQSTSSNRMKIYVNGSQITSFSTETYPSQNFDTSANQSGLPQRIGMLDGNAGVFNQYFDGYMAEVNFVDGQALDPTDFGEFKSDVWIPKSYSGTHGTNGYYLPFNDAGFLGKDASTVLGSELVTNGTFDTNINNWTVHNGATLAFSNNRLSIFKDPLSSNAGAYQAISVESGKTYSIEATVDKGTTNGARVGVEYTLGGRDGVETSSNTGGHFQFNFTSTTTGTVYVRCFIQSSGTAYFDNISVKEIITQGNDFTSINLLPTDQMLDSPTNNFATLNPLEAGNGTYAEGNLKFSANTASAHQMASSTASISSGKWYAEILIQVVGGTYPHVGITPVATSNATYVGNNGYGYRSDGKKQALAASAESYGATYTSGDIIGIAFDADSGSITFYKNGSSQGVADSSIDTSTTWRFSNSLYSTGGISIANFGQDSSFAGNKTAQGNTDANGRGDFFYAPPAGFLALCTANLPDPAIDPAQDDVPADYFNTVLYTGNGSTQSITGVGFEPDLVWVKSRSAAVLHSLLDVVRGANKYLSSNNDDSEATPASNNRITSIDADGFSLGNSSNTNDSGDTYVAWNWKAGGTGVSNSDGTITSTVSANTDAGFSIVAYNGSSAGTVGHGLSSTPQLVIQKSRDASSGGYWWTGTTVIDGTLDYFQLNDTNAKTDSGYSLPTSSVFSNVPFTGGTNQVAYCFHSVEGFSKFGTYTGNGSDDGPFIYTGFRPAFVIMKRTDNTGFWIMHDSKRDPYNVADNYLFANDIDAESSYDNLDFLSNGFKLRLATYNPNVSSGTYIYMAFAEMPFKYANAR
jgi:hypothetical protein